MQKQILFIRLAHTSNFVSGISLIIFLLICILATGCGTIKMYGGPELTKDRVAVIKSCKFLSCGGLSLGPSAETSIQSANGKSASGLGDDIAVLPGYYTLQVCVKVLPPYWQCGGSISFNAAAGHVYRVLGVAADRIRIVDAETGDVVAGKKLNYFQGR